MSRIPIQLAANTAPLFIGGGSFHRTGGKTCPACGGLYVPWDKRDPWHAYHPRCRPKNMRGFFVPQGMITGMYATESIAGEIEL